SFAEPGDCRHAGKHRAVATTRIPNKVDRTITLHDAVVSDDCSYYRSRAHTRQNAHQWNLVSPLQQLESIAERIEYVEPVESLEWLIFDRRIPGRSAAIRELR